MLKEISVASQEHLKRNGDHCGISKTIEANLKLLTLCSESLVLRFPNPKKEREKHLERADVFRVFEHRKYNAL